MRSAGYVAHISEIGNLTEKSEGMRPLRKLGVNGRIILKETFKK
jgi:hypothetical protein